MFRHAGPDKPAPASFKPGASGNFNRFRIPAFAGMTVLGLFTEASHLAYCKIR
ncbi:MAG: hypothetical protein WBN77_00460 [Desulfobacterales bacterium]|uniref:Uncharacterized protein n=1 Tax=uncultured Desulfobacterium sp. TaxID=201089 RepID=E1YB52_9BACT|nr:unknown protein [uncultured Desulfobacterium sp.]